jgi:hypothetical protein
VHWRARGPAPPRSNLRPRAVSPPPTVVRSPGEIGRASARGRESGRDGTGAPGFSLADDGVARQLHVLALAGIFRASCRQCMGRRLGRGTWISLDVGDLFDLMLLGFESSRP